MSWVAVVNVIGIFFIIVMLRKTLKRMLRGILRRALGIKSPSVVFMEMNSDMLKGMEDKK